MLLIKTIRSKLYAMKKHKTQQFSKFFLKDIATKNPKSHSDKSDIDNLRISQTS